MAESSVKCEVRITGAKNIVTKRQGAVFVKCYLSVGKNRRVQLSTREVMSSNNEGDCIFWDESFSLECNGEETSISSLKDEKIVFELRWRSAKTNFLGKPSSSHLLARAEMTWKNVFDAPRMEVQNWVSMTRSKTECLDECCIKPPALQVGVKVEVPESTKTVSREEMRRIRRHERLRNWDGCGCKKNHRGFCSCADNNELFLVAAVLDVC